MPLLLECCAEIILNAMRERGKHNNHYSFPQEITLVKNFTRSLKIFIRIFVDPDEDLVRSSSTSCKILEDLSKIFEVLAKSLQGSFRSLQGSFSKMIYRLHEHHSRTLNLHEKKQIKIQQQALSVIQLLLYFISWSYNAALKKQKLKTGTICFSSILLRV